MAGAAVTTSDALPRTLTLSDICDCDGGGGGRIFSLSPPAVHKRVGKVCLA
jgi:hypothetical protein